uniref:FGGY_N domain-containing protein n=1 Tax=Mesocestoides corti TaxID=53468 RepID=A0A5K3FD71_MESCO
MTMSLNSHFLSQSLIVSVDFGSTHACARIYDESCRSLAESVLPSGELDPESYWQVLCNLLSSVLKSKLNFFFFISLGSHVPSSAVYCLGLSVQRNTFLLWDRYVAGSFDIIRRKTSKPVSRLCTWQETNASAYASSRNNTYFIKALNKTGKVLYKIVPCTKFKLASHFKLTCIFVVTRLAHMFDEDPTLYERCRKGELVFGCLETWFLWRLTGGRAWCTDVSCISTTGAFDPCQLGISPIIMNLVEMSPKIFPAICPTSTFYGEVRFGPLGRSPEELAAGIKRVRVTALIGDSQAAMLGEGCLNRGDAKLTLGTGAFLNVNIGSKAIPPKTGFYPVIGWAQSVRSNAEESCERIADTKLSNVTYLLEGFNSDAGNTLTRLKDSGFFRSYSELEEILSYCSRGRNSFLCALFVGLLRVSQNAHPEQQPRESTHLR